MPKIYDYFGLIFLFYSNDHQPIHIHVRKSGAENKIEFIYENGKLKDVVLKKVKGRPELDLNSKRDALKIARLKSTDISQKWLDYFGKNKPIKCLIIRKKIE